MVGNAWWKFELVLKLCPGIGSHQFLFFIYEIMLRNTYSTLAALASHGSQ